MQIAFTKNEEPSLFENANFFYKKEARCTVQYILLICS